MWIRKKILKKANKLLGNLFSLKIASLADSLDTSWLESQKTLGLFLKKKRDTTENTFFVLHASFGDKWCVLSYLGDHLKYYPSSIILASTEDRDLCGVFFEKNILHKRFIFIDREQIQILSAYFKPTKAVSTQIVDSWYQGGCFHTVTPFLLKNGLPSGKIRHLHIVHYPYFNELYHLHGVSYGTLLKTILYLPASSRPKSPTNYSRWDSEAVSALTKIPNESSDGFMRHAVLLNTVNFSQAPLSAAQIKLILSILETKGFWVLVNTAQGKNLPELSRCLSGQRHARCTDVPPQLVALLSNRVYAVMGVLGGAMNIAAQFSNAHLLSLQTPALGTGVRDEELFGPWAGENYWKFVNQDWPCLQPGRVIENHLIGDPAQLKEEKLVSVIEAFLEKLPANRTGKPGGK